MTEHTTPIVLEGFTQLTLTAGQCLTASGNDASYAFADAAAPNWKGQELPGMQVVNNGQPDLPQGHLAVKGPMVSQALRLQCLLEAGLAELDWPSLDGAGVVLSTPDPMEAMIPGLDRAATLVTTHTLEAVLAQWQAALSVHPDVERWVWIALDTRLYMDWLERNPLYCSATRPEGIIPGEALVITEWSRSKDNGFQVGFAGHHLEPNSEQAMHKAVTARAELLRLADPEISQRQPGWGEYLTNDGPDQPIAVERYKAERALWPDYRRTDVFGPCEPSLSWVPATGDVGLATLPLGLVLARERLSHTLIPANRVGVLVNDGPRRHYWHLSRPTHS